MDNNTKERYAAAMERFISEVENRIEGSISDWKDKNPYWEVDDEDCNGNRTFRYPRTTSNDARESLSEDFISSGGDVQNVDCSNFFEFVINEIYGFGLNKDNPYREKRQEKTSEPLTTTEKAIAAMSIGTANFIDELFGSALK